MVRKYPPKKENGQGIYGSLYKVSLPESQFAKHTTLGFPLKKKLSSHKGTVFLYFPEKVYFFDFWAKIELVSENGVFVFQPVFFSRSLKMRK